MARFCTSIEQDADLRVEDTAETRKEPSVGVNLLAVLLLQTEHHLHRRESGWAVVQWADQLLVWRHGELGRVFEDVCHRLFTVDVLLHDAVLVDTDRCKDIERALVAGIDTVKNHAHHDLLPCRPALIPEFGFLEIDNIADILHHAVQCSRCQGLVLIIVGDGDQQLGVSVINRRTQFVAILQRKVIRIARRRGVSQMGELLAPTLQIIAVLRLHSVLNRRGDRVVRTQHGALHELHLTRGASFQRTSSFARSWVRTLPPCLRTARIAPFVRRHGSAGRAIIVLELRAIVALVMVSVVRRHMATTAIGANIGFFEAVARGIVATGRADAAIGFIERALEGTGGILVEEGVFLLVVAVVARRVRLDLGVSLALM